MTLSVSPEGYGPFTKRIAQETDGDKAGELNVVGGATTLEGATIEKTSGSVQAFLKVYDHDGDGWSASSKASLILPLGGTTGRVEVDFDPPLPLENGCTFASAQEDGDDLTTDPDATFDVRLVCT